MARRTITYYDLHSTIENVVHCLDYILQQNGFMASERDQHYRGRAITVRFSNKLGIVFSFTP